MNCKKYTHYNERWCINILYYRITVGSRRIYENADADERVFNLLDGSVDKEIGAFDIKQTATAPLLYGMMGDTAIKESLKFAAVPMDEENAKKFLKSLPKEALVPLLSILCETCSTSRRDEVAKILTEFKD